MRCPARPLRRLRHHLGDSRRLSETLSASGPREIWGDMGRYDGQSQASGLSRRRWSASSASAAPRVASGAACRPPAGEGPGAVSEGSRNCLGRVCDVLPVFPPVRSHSLGGAPPLATRAPSSPRCTRATAPRFALSAAPTGSSERFREGSRLCRRCRCRGASLPGATTRRGAEDAAAAEDGVASGAAPSPSGVASVVSLRPPEMSCWRNLRHSSGLGPEAGGSAAHSAGAPQRVVRAGSSLRVEQAGTERRRSAALDRHISKESGFRGVFLF